MPESQQDRTQVIVVGGGPVGLTLAIDLARRGVRSTLIERRAEPQQLPKMELCNSRTMEIYRQLGLSQTIRNAGYPQDAPTGVYLVTSMNEPPIAHLEYPTIGAMLAKIAAQNDGTLPLESFQRISQYTIESILRGTAERLPEITCRFATTLEELVQDADGVTACVIDSAGRRRTVRADYLVGCDGANSMVRELVEIDMVGPSNIARLLQVYFRHENLNQHHPLGWARHFVLPAPVSGSLVVQSDQMSYSIHSTLPPDTDPRWLINHVVGAQVDAEVRYTGVWTLHMQVAAEYRRGRVLLAGDAAHRFSPTSGLSMNTGIGDAADLAWKLAGMLAGWGGDGLLDAYGVERRHVGLRNSAVSEYALRGVFAWTKAYDAGVRGAELSAIIGREAGKPYEVAGAELGYRYRDSPILAYGMPSKEGEEDAFDRYRPIVEVGRRLPHVWVAPNISTHDLVDRGYTLFCIDPPATGDVTRLVKVFTDLGATLNVLHSKNPAAVQVYGRGYLLIRPDVHIAWRGESLPNDPNELAKLVTGNLRTNLQRAI